METPIAWFSDQLRSALGLLHNPSELQAFIFYCVLAPSLIVAALRFWHYRQVLRDSEGVAEVRVLLEKHGEWREGYFLRLRRGLAWVDDRLGERTLSGCSYDFSLRMVFVYPIVSLLFVWAITGKNTYGISGLLPEDADAWPRAMAIGSIGLASTFVYTSAQTSGWRQQANLAYAFAVAFAVAVGGAVAFVDAVVFGAVVAVHLSVAAAFGFAVAAAAAVVFARAVAGGGAVAAAFVLVVAGGVAFAIAGGGAVAAAFAVAVAFAGGGAVVVAVAGAVVLAGAFAAVVVVAIAFAGAVDSVVAGGGVVAGAIAGTVAIVVAVAFALLKVQEVMSRRGHQGLFYLLYVPLLLLAISTAAFHASSLHLYHEASKSLLFFLGLLPLMNSIFAWLSLAATRRLLRHVAEGKYALSRVAGMALADLAIGIGLLVALAATCSAGVQTMNLLSRGNGGADLFDVAGLLGRMRTSPGDNAAWWVYFMLFSTLLPTLVHSIVAAGSFVAWGLPERLRQHWLTILANHDLSQNHGWVIGMAWRLTALDAAAVVLGVFAIATLGVLGWWLLPQVGWMLLALCEHVAQALGAMVMPGPFFHA